MNTIPIDVSSLCFNVLSHWQKLPQVVLDARTVRLMVPLVILISMLSS